MKANTFVVKFSYRRFCSTSGIANKDFSGMRSSSPASKFVTMDSDAARNPLLAIPQTVVPHTMTQI